MINIGIIGCGKMAGAHIAALAHIPTARVTAVCDVDEAKRNELAEKTGARAYMSYVEMTEKEALQLVMICLPPGMHGVCARHCAEKGINIFLEKPMGIDSGDCRAMIEECKKYGVMLWVGHMQCYSLENRIAKEIIDSGEYGKLIAINEFRCCEYPKETSPKWIMDRKIAGGGMLFNLGSHTIDMAQFLGGSRVDAAACSANFLENGTENMASGFLKLENGVAVTFNLIGSCKHRKYQIELYLTEGQIRISPWERVEACGKDGIFKTVASTKEIYENDEKGWQYYQLCDVVKGAETGTAKVPGEYGLAIIECLEALYRSAGRK